MNNLYSMLIDISHDNDFKRVFSPNSIEYLFHSNRLVGTNAQFLKNHFLQFICPYFALVS